MPQTILYIEDNQVNMDLVQALCESGGYAFIGASSGQDGINMAQEYLPDLIICDYHLPYMNGHDVVSALRGDDKTKHIPVMMLTADLYSRSEFDDLNIEAYINKPIRRNMFLQQVNNILNPSE